MGTRKPKGPLETARHYVRELIYGANDGVITTLAALLAWPAVAFRCVWS